MAIKEALKDSAFFKSHEVSLNWLIEQNKDTEAKKSLKFFRGKTYDISDELNEIKQKHRDDGHPILGRSTRSIKTTRSGMWPPGPEFPSLSSSVSSMPSYKEPILNKVLHLDVGGHCFCTFT